MPEFAKGRLLGGKPALCPRSGPHAVDLEALMINLVACPCCLRPNYLEAGALSLHVQLVHVTHLALSVSPGSDETGAMDQRPKMILCAHADDDSIEAHWRLSSEPCRQACSDPLHGS